MQNLLQQEKNNGIIKPKFDKTEPVDEEFVKTLAEL